MKSLIKNINKFQLLLTIPFCLVSSIKMNGMQDTFALRIKYSFCPNYSGDFIKTETIPYNKQNQQVDGKILKSIIYKNLTEQQKEKLLIVRGYYRGIGYEEVVMWRKEIDQGLARSVEEMKDMHYLGVISFLDNK